MDKEIRENNRIIAEFMGAYRKEFHDEIFAWWFEVAPTKHSSHWWDIHAMEYHSSWDWIMGPIDRISQTVIKGHEPFNSDQFARVEIVPSGYVRIENFRDSPIFTNVSVEGSLISAVYKAVVAFIIWYNNQPK